MGNELPVIGPVQENVDPLDADYEATIKALKTEDPVNVAAVEAAHKKKLLDEKLEDNTLSGVEQVKALLESSKLSDQTQIVTE